MTTASENPQETKKQRSCPEIGFRVRPFASIGKHLRQCLFVLLLLATAVLAQPKASAVTLPTSVPTANATWVLEDMANLFMRSGDSDSVTSPTVYKLYCFMPDVSGSYSILVMPTGSLNPIFRVYDSSGYYIEPVPKVHFCHIHK